MDFVTFRDLKIRCLTAEEANNEKLLENKSDLFSYDFNEKLKVIETDIQSLFVFLYLYLGPPTSIFKKDEKYLYNYFIEAIYKQKIYYTSFGVNSNLEIDITLYTDRELAEEIKQKKGEEISEAIKACVEAKIPVFVQSTLLYNFKNILPIDEETFNKNKELCLENLSQQETNILYDEFPTPTDKKSKKAQKQRIDKGLEIIKIKTDQSKEEIKKYAKLLFASSAEMFKMEKKSDTKKFTNAFIDFLQSEIHLFGNNYLKINGFKEKTWEDWEEWYDHF